MTKTKAFSFTQFLVVVAIVGILTAIVIPAYGEYTSKAKANKMLQDVKELKAAVSNYRTINGKFAGITDPKEIQEIYGIQNPEENSSVINKITIKSDGRDAIIISVIGSGDSLSLKQGQSLQLDLYGTWSMDKGITWECKAKGQTKYAPVGCKPYENESKPKN